MMVQSDPSLEKGKIRRIVTIGVAGALMGAGGLFVTDAPAASHGRWTKPRVVLDASKRIHDPQVALGPRGYAVLTWISGEPEAVPDTDSTSYESGSVWVSVRHPGQRRFRRPRVLSDPGSRAVNVGVAANGQTVVTWLDADDNVRATFRDLDEGWSEPQTVAGPVPRGANLAVAADGTAIATWAVGELAGGMHEIYAAVRSPGGPFDKPVMLALDSGVGTYGPVPAVAPGGHGLVTWSGVCPLEPEGREDARAAFLLPSSSSITGTMWGTPEEIPNSKCPTGGIAAAIDARGAAVVVINGHPRWWGGIRAAVRQPGESLSEARLISRRRQETNFARVGMSRSGKTVVVWPTYKNGKPRGLQAAVGIGAGFTAPRRFSSGRDVILWDLAVSPRGHAVVLWQSLGSWRLKAAYMRPDRWFGVPERVSPRLTKEELAQQVVAIDARGRALAAWGRPHRQAFQRGMFVSNRPGYN